MSEKVISLQKEKRDKKDKYNIDLKNIPNDYKGKPEIYYLNKYFLEYSENSEALKDEKIDKSFSIIDKNIIKKLNSYKQQDTKKEIYNEDQFISKNSVIELLVSSKLVCEYCNCNMTMFPEKVYQANQWTLDRIDNDIGHNEGNIIISCYKCNIQRRKMDKDRFQEGKKIVKIMKVG